MSSLQKEVILSDVQYLSFINELYEKGNLVDVALHCFDFCKQHRMLRNQVENIFVHSLCVYGQFLEKCNLHDELICFYKEVLDLYPRNLKLNCNYGAHLVRIGMVKEAENLFETVLTWNGNCLPAFKNLLNIYNLQVERWHFRMLNDQSRNEAFKQAIQRKIKQNFDTVLDIGTGTGLLSVYAAKNGAAATYACDHSEKMIEIASKVISYNKVDVKLLNRMSFSLVIGVDIPKRVSLVVTEIMDCGLLGEGLLSTILHAWDELLLPPASSNAKTYNEGMHGSVIPSKVSFWVNIIECDAIGRRYVFPIHQRTVTSSNQTCSSLYLDNIVLYANKVEPYDTEQLQMFEFKYLSEFQRLLSVNLNDREDVWKNINKPELCKTTLKITCSSAGYAHAIVGCFKAILDENIVLSNDPTIQRDSCWEQAVFPLKEAVKVVEGSLLVVNANWLDEKITLELIKVIHPPGIILPPLITLENQKHASLEEECLPDDISILEYRNEAKAFEVSAEVVSLFNDEHFVNHLYRCADYFISYFTPHCETLFILDESVFPFLGLMILRNLHLLPIDLTAVKLMINLDVSLQYRDLIKHVLKGNEIMETNIEQFDINELSRLDNTKRGSLDMIICDVIEKEGDLNDLKMLDMKIFRESLKATGSLYPLSMSIQFQLVQCSWLDNVSTIKNSEITDMGIAPLMNKYKVVHHLDINLDRVSYVPLSEVLEAVQFSLGMIRDQLKPLKIKVPITQSGTVTGICYWYHMYYRPDEYYSTLNSTSHYRQAAFLTVQDTKVTVNDTVFVDFQYVEGIIKLSMDIDNDNSLVKCSRVPVE